MQKTLENIVEILRELKPILKSLYNVDELDVFGSYAKLNSNEKSDLDLLVSFSKKPSLLKFLQLENFLSDKLKLKVDLVMKSSLKSSIKNEILDSSIVI